MARSCGACCRSRASQGARQCGHPASPDRSWYCILLLMQLAQTAGRYALSLRGSESWWKHPTLSPDTRPSCWCYLLQETACELPGGCMTAAVIGLRVNPEADATAKGGRRGTCAEKREGHTGMTAVQAQRRLEELPADGAPQRAIQFPVRTRQGQRAHQA